MGFVDTIPEGQYSSEKGLNLLTAYRLLDYAVGFSVVSPLVIIAFRGLWVLEDGTIFPENAASSAIVSFVLGHLLIFICYLSQTFFLPVAVDISKKPAFHIVAPLYKLLWGCAFINQWRSIWIFYDLLLGSGLRNAVIALSFSTVFLVSFRCLPLIGSTSPHLFLWDSQPNEIFQCIPRFSTTFKSPIKHIFDCCLSVFLIQSMVVVCWKSYWTLMDLTFYPPTFPRSQLSSLFLGLCLTLLSYTVEDLVHCCAKRLTSLQKILFQNLWLFYCGVCCITTWHGLWTFMDGAIGTEPLVSFCSFLTPLYLLSAFFDVSLLYTKSILVENRSFQPKSHVVLLKIRYFSDIYKSIPITELSDKRREWKNHPTKLSIVALEQVKLSHQENGWYGALLRSPETIV